MHPDWKAKTTIKELVDGLMGNVGPRPPEGLRQDVEDVIQRAIEISKPPNLSDPTVQKRLAAQWGYVPDDEKVVTEGWLRAVDEALVVAGIGTATADDTYEQAKKKLDSLLGFHTTVATDPAVNGGWKLMPIEPTKEIYECFAAYDGTSYSNPFDFDDFKADYAFALAAAPEAKP